MIVLTCNDPDVAVLARPAQGADVLIFDPEFRRAILAAGNFERLRRTFSMERYGSDWPLRQSFKNKMIHGHGKKVSVVPGVIIVGELLRAEG